MTSIREAFVATFGEQLTVAIEAAADSHAAEHAVIRGRGSDPFKWTLMTVIGHECISRDRFRAHHGIDVPYETLKDWIIRFGDLGSHDGDIDWLSAIAGVFNDYLNADARQAWLDAERKMEL